MISFIIPVYNASRYIDRCLNSILDQNTENFEIICIDDGSKDNSLEILNKYVEKYPRKFNVISQENQGIGPTRNNAFKYAKGNYTWFIDNDDCIHPNCLKEIESFIQEFSPDIINIHYLCDKFDKNPFPNTLKEQLQIKKISQDFAMSLYQDAPWSKIYNTEFLRKNNLKFQNIFGEDTSVTFDLYSKTKKIYEIKQPLYAWIERGESFSHAIFSEKHFKTFPKLLKILKEQSEKAPANLKVYYEALMLIKSFDFLPKFEAADVPEELKPTRDACLKESKKIIEDLPENIYYELYKFHKTQFDDLWNAKKQKEQEIKDSYEHTVSWEITKPVRMVRKIIKDL